MTSELISGIGPRVRTVTGNVPVASAAATLTGVAFDRSGYNSCVLVCQTGAATGAPSTIAVDSKIQHSDTSGGSYTDFAGGSITQLTAASSLGRKSVNLLGAKQWVRVVTGVAFTGGTSPTIGVASSVVLGGAVELPAQSDT